MKVAVVGIGGWGKNHLRVVAQLRGRVSWRLSTQWT